MTRPRLRFSFYILRSHTVALTSLLALALLYLAALIFLPPQALTYHDEGAKYLQVRNLRLAPVGLDWSINYPARRLDPQLEFVPFHPKQHYVDAQGRIYLQWPIFLGLLTRVFWKLMGFRGLYVVPLLAGLGTLWASYLLALAVGVPKRIAWLAVPLVGLATPVALYSLLYFEHTLASLLVVLSLLAAVQALSGNAYSTKGMALSGVLLAVAVYFRSELYVLALVIAAALAVAGWRKGSRRLPLIWVGAFALSLVPLWAFYAINEGSLLPAHALWYFAGSEPSNAGGIPRPGLPPLRYIASAGWSVVPSFLFGPQDAPYAVRLPAWAEVVGLLGVGLCLLAALGKLMRFRQAWRLPILVLGLALVLVSTGTGLLFPQAYYNLHGFLLASPFIVMSLWPDKGNEGAIMPFGFLYAVSLAYVGLHALVISALSGLGPISLHEWGQRYLLPAYPLLAVLSLAAVSRIRVASSPKLAAACLALWVALVLVGAGFTLRGYTALSEERAQVASWLSLVKSMPDAEPLVTDAWWLPLNLAADFYSRPIMLAEGDDRLAQWANMMKAKGIRHFGFATSNPSVFAGGWTRQMSGLSADGPPQEASGVWLQMYSLTP